MKKILLFILFIGIIQSYIYCQKTEIYHPHIQTVQSIVNENYALSPTIILDSDDFIDISFDLLSHDYQRYYYTITHCDANWEVSNLSEFDYLDGFNNNVIIDYENSINTTVPYTHYRFRLPNDDITFKISGNYQLTIYDDNSQEPILKTYFRITEELVSISAKVSSNTDIDHNKGYQQIEFDINHKGYIIRNPQQEIKVHVLQNGRFDNMIKNIIPSFVSPNQIKYNHNRNLIFSAGNEYRRFEIVSTKYAGLGVENISYHNPYYHVTLFPTSPRILNYNYDEDQNGKYIVRYNDAIDSEIEADYFFVHFTLECDEPFVDGHIYLNGEFTYDGFNPQTEMRYNSDKYIYESVQLLKQGSYNYQFLYLPTGASKGETGPIEGNFYQTENEYTIFVYHRQFGERYDRLIAVKNIRYIP